MGTDRALVCCVHLHSPGTNGKSFTSIRFSLLVAFPPFTVHALGMADGRAILGWSQELPLTLDVLLLELVDQVVGNLVKVFGSQGQDGWSSTAQADTQQTWVSFWGQRLEDLRQTWDQSLAVWLVNAVLHGEVDELRVWRAVTQGNWEEGYSLQVEDDIRTAVFFREDLARLGSWNFELWNNGYALDLWRPLEFVVVTDVEWGLGWLETSVDASGRLGKNLTERNFKTFRVDWIELVEIGADEATVESRCYIIWMALHLFCFASADYFVSSSGSAIP
jgi:hypothetical protein